MPEPQPHSARRAAAFSLSTKLEYRYTKLLPAQDRRLEHDPKNACTGRDPECIPVFGEIMRHQEAGAR
jgi:hypothetical protein